MTVLCIFFHCYRFCLFETSCEQEDNFPSSLCVKVNGKICPLPVSIRFELINLTIGMSTQTFVVNRPLGACRTAAQCGGQDNRFLLSRDWNYFILSSKLSCFGLTWKGSISHHIFQRVMKGVLIPFSSQKFTKYKSQSCKILVWVHLVFESSLIF